MKPWIAALALMLPMFDASACSCSSTPLSEKVEGASFVAVVRVESTRLRPNAAALLTQEEFTHEGWLPILADFVPVDVLKGDTREVAVLASGFGGGDCGIHLTPGFDYLVIGDPIAGELAVGLCSGSEPLGVQSLVASLPDAERWKRNSPRVEAIRRQIERGESIPACLDNNPRFFGESDDCEADAYDVDESEED